MHENISNKREAGESTRYQENVCLCVCLCLCVCTAASVNKVNADMGQGRADDVLTETGNAPASSAALGHKRTLKADSSENTICQSHPK